MLIPKKFSTLLFSTIFVFLSCQNNSTKDTSEIITDNSNNDTIDNVTVIEDSSNKIHEISRLLAGLDSVPSFLSSKNPSPFLEFYKNSQKKFKKIQQNRLNKLNTWCSRILKDKELPDSNFCFYPFAGGDFIHAHYLYPNANEYLMLALEPCGTLPDFHEFSENEIIGYLNNLDTVLKNIYMNSYFITKKMYDQINKKQMVDGVLPLIVWGIAKAGYEIREIEHFNIDSLGRAVKVDAKNANLEKSKAFKIKVIKNDETKIITYLSADVSNDGLFKSPGIKLFLQDRIPKEKTTSFIKSASYLLHHNFFSEIRNIVLSKSSIIIQDDTGVPYKFVNNSNWEKLLYGKYEKPIEDFSEKLFQGDLDSAYHDSSKHKGLLNFTIGYHWNTGYQNQMFFYKNFKG